MLGQGGVAFESIVVPWVSSDSFMPKIDFYGFGSGANRACLSYMGIMDAVEETCLLYTSRCV